LRLIGLCALAALTLSAVAHGQTPPRDTSARRDSTRRVVMPRPAADSDTTKRANLLGIPGTDALPFQLNLRIETKTERDRNLSCNSLEAAQINALTGCNAGFIFPTIEPKFSLTSSGTIGDHVHVNVDYDAQREFQASNTVSLYYEGKPGDHLQRLDLGNISFAAPWTS